MTTATVHNPTHFEPKDYEIEDYLDNRQPQYFGQGLPTFELEVADWKAEMLRVVGPDWRSKVGHCVHCGNGRVRWITIARHLPTNERVVFGVDCTKRLGFADKHAFKLAQLQARAEARKVRFTIWNQREAFLTANPAIREALAHIDDAAHARNWFVKDVLAKLDKYGSLSERQVNAVVASLKRDTDLAARKAADATEVKGDAPTGRTDVTGTVLSKKTQDSDFGPVEKMLVKLTNNARVWLTVPGKEVIERGDTVTVRATWTPSKDDKSFGFGKRPHLVSRTPAASPAVAAAA